jgi:hypothetical protein
MAGRRFFLIIRHICYACVHLLREGPNYGFCFCFTRFNFFPRFL